MYVCMYVYIYIYILKIDLTRSIFQPEMHQIGLSFGGRTPPGHAEGAYSAPHRLNGSAKAWYSDHRTYRLHATYVFTGHLVYFVTPINVGRCGVRCEMISYTVQCALIIAQRRR